MGKEEEEEERRCALREVCLCWTRPSLITAHLFRSPLPPGRLVVDVLTFSTRPRTFQKENSDLCSRACVSEIPSQEVIPCPQQVAELRLQQGAPPPHVPRDARETAQPRSHSVSSAWLR